MVLHANPNCICVTVSTRKWRAVDTSAVKSDISAKLLFVADLSSASELTFVHNNIHFRSKRTFTPFEIRYSQPIKLAVILDPLTRVQNDLLMNMDEHGKPI